MIELENITKIYEAKKGAKTVALSNLSMKFGDKGLVFITGKSGSGKSTLLNVIGGLDKYDSGNMTILGKSSRDFKNEDFDSYRNTYIGFVFQEFNILPDYDVYENIVLALQLQQKKIDQDKINQLLMKLELSELKNRKVNEMSGGQKQRVAIARALVKEPKIILADEPTGNLDSVTSKQVMEILKEISKETLVVIVSHDTESAMIYGDRIIEIKDGQIEKDTYITQAQNEQVTGDYRTVKSKLPFKESFKLGFQSLKCKKVKLVFTIILIIFTLLFLSISDTLSSYNVEKAHSHLLAEKNEKFVQIEKYSFYDSDGYDYYNKGLLELTDNDINQINQKLKEKGKIIYKLASDSGYRLSMEELLKIKYDYNSTSSYIYPMNEVDIVELDDFNSFFNENIIGRFPLNSNEILIPNYLADLIMTNGITPYIEESDDIKINNNYKPKDYEELVNSNKYFHFGNTGKIKIVGIIDYDLSEYQSLKSKNWDVLSKQENENSRELRHKAFNIYNKIYVNSSFMNDLDIDTPSLLGVESSLNVENLKSRNDIYMRAAMLNKEVEYFDGNVWQKISKLNKNEMILNINQLSDFDFESYKQQLDTYLGKNKEQNQRELEKQFFELYISNIDVIGKTASLTTRTGEGEEEFKNIKIVGLMGDDTFINYFSEELVGKYKINPIQKTGILVMENTRKGFQSIMQDFKYNATLSTKSTYSEDVYMLIRTIFILKNIAFYTSLVFLTFAIFLIGNFMFSSINYRKKEIGVLRALGARSLDVVKIFTWEGIVIATISATLSSIILIFVTSLLNTVIMEGTDMIITPFIVGIRQFIVMYLIVFSIVLVSSFLPIMKISRKKPIDAILEK